MATQNERGGWDLTDDDVAEVMAASFGAQVPQTDHLPEYVNCRTCGMTEVAPGKIHADYGTEPEPRWHKAADVKAALRACEARVTERHNAEHEDDRLTVFQNGYVAGKAAAFGGLSEEEYQRRIIVRNFKAGVQAARDAVDSAKVRGQHRAWVFKDDALAAIDAVEVAHDEAIASVVAELDSIDSGDPERDHSDADTILLAATPAPVREAYERLVKRSRWWATA